MSNNNDSGSHRPRKRFGQNFLCDDVVIHNIASAINANADDHIIEIGPGQGALTAELLTNQCQLDAIELDRDLIPVLNKRFSQHQHFKVLQADALEMDFSTLQRGNEKLRIVGNLPYNISTPLIFHLLSQQHLVQDMHFMLQLEVVKRLAARPSTKEYGRLSVMTQYYCKVDSLFEVPPQAFNPVPKVRSAIVKLQPHQTLPVVARNIEALQHVLRTAFNQRRKTVRNCLKSLIDTSCLEQLNIDPAARPENLSLEQFVTISNAISPDE